MTFSAEWEALFKANTHLSVWPWSDLVSLVSRHARPAESFTRVLELGCGVGANVSFFLERGADYHAVEGSASAVELLRKAYPAIAGNVACGDFTRDLPPGPFDLVVDRAATAHNATEAIRNTLAMVYARLRTGGWLIGVDWFSDRHDGARLGIAVDGHTRRGITHGSLSGLGEVHFFDQAHLEDLLNEAGFKIEALEHKHTEVFGNAAERHRGWWNFAAIKP